MIRPFSAATITIHIQALNVLEEHLAFLQLWFKRWRVKIDDIEWSRILPFSISKQLLFSSLLRTSPGLNTNLECPHTPQKNGNRMTLLVAPLISRNPFQTTTTQQASFIHRFPSWSYGIELWGSIKLSNLCCLQSLQSKILRKLSHLTFYVPNIVMHKDLHVTFI